MLPSSCVSHELRMRACILLARLFVAELVYVRANCYCASLLRTQIRCHVMHRAHALSTK